MPDGDAAPEQERPAAGEEAEVAKDDAMEVDGGAKESEEQGGGDGKTGLSSDSEDDEPAEGETKAPAQNNAAEGKTGLSDSSEDEESGEKQASAMAGEKAGSGEGGASEKAPLTKKDVFGSDDSSDEEESGAPKVPGQKVLVGPDGTLVRGPTEEAPAHALENIGDNVGVTEEVRERETHLNNLDSMVVHVTMPELPRPPADSKLCYVRMTKHFQMESSEWKGTLTSAAGLATNVVRWRYKKRDGDSMEEDSETREIESNARIVQWSDGSYTMHVGDETLECKHEATENNVHHLFVKQAAEQSATKDPLMMIESHGIVNDRFAVRPFRSSKVSRAIMSTISREFNQRTDKSDLLIKKQVDAAEHAQELAQQESMRMRNQARSAAQKRRSGYGGAMTEDFLERDVEEGDVGGMARQWKQRNRVSNADALRRAKRGAVRGGKRPRDSDESSSSSEDEAPARRRAASPSESSSSSDASDAEEVALKKRAAPAKKSHVVDSSSDDD